jgi:hypothetical protein
LGRAHALRADALASADAGSRKTLIYLILTLNHMYPDWDFSNLRSHVRCWPGLVRPSRARLTPLRHAPLATAQNFTKEDGFASTRAAVEAALLEPARLWAGVTGGGSMGSSAHALETLWARLEEVIQPAECDVYSYKGDAEGDPFTVPGSLWSFNFFLYNRKLKRILFFTASAISKRGGGDDDGMGGGGDEEDDDARGAGFFQLDDDDMDL